MAIHSTTNFRRTKIIATLGPASDKLDDILSLAEAGANVFRLNMSHAPREWCREVAQRVREAAVALQANLGLLMDLKGPTIRTGDLPAPVQLCPGDEVEFRLLEVPPTRKVSTTANYPGLYADLKLGDLLRVDNGVIEMRAIDLSPARVICTVLTEGVLGSRRHINLPGIKVNLPPLAEQDFADLDLAAELSVDFVAMSFVRDGSHVQLLREELARRNMPARVCAKIEDQQAVHHLDSIIEHSDIVMVARGDLGIEVSYEEIPFLQKKIINKCISAGKRVIVATHMLESMSANPVPTRAEVSDICHAVAEQPDAIMLSGETSSGEYPRRCVEVMDRLARRTERETTVSAAASMELTNDKQRVVKAAVQLADSFKGSSILVFTRRGIMAGYASRVRPVRAPIFVFTEDETVRRFMSLSRGVIDAFTLPFQEDPEESISSAIRLLHNRRLIASGEKLVIISDCLHKGLNTDAILVRTAAGN